MHLYPWAHGMQSIRRGRFFRSKMSQRNDFLLVLKAICFCSVRTCSTGLTLGCIYATSLEATFARADV